MWIWPTAVQTKPFRCKVLLWMQTRKPCRTCRFGQWERITMANRQTRLQQMDASAHWWCSLTAPWTSKCSSMSSKSLLFSFSVSTFHRPYTFLVFTNDVFCSDNSDRIFFTLRYCTLRRSRYQTPAETDKKMDVFYVGGKLPEHEASMGKALRNVPGRYIKSETEMKWTKGPASIEWDEKRRRWNHSVADRVLFCLPCDEAIEAVETTPAAEGWRATSQTNLPAPCYRRSQLVSLDVMMCDVWCEFRLMSKEAFRFTKKHQEPCGANIVEWHSMIMSGVMNHSHVTIMSVLLSVPKEAIDFERSCIEAASMIWFCPRTTETFGPFSTGPPGTPWPSVMTGDQKDYLVSLSKIGGSSGR